MRKPAAFLLLLAIGSVGEAAAQGTVHQDPSGFQVNLPAGWKVQKYEGGQVVIAAANPSEWALVMPILSRSRDCPAALQANLTSGWQAYPKVKDLKVRVVRPGLALADFLYLDGQSRGALLCAETGPRSGMLYGMAAPAALFPGEKDRLLGVLKSFRYGTSGPATQSSAPPGGANSLPMEPWREPSENAFTSVKPQGWRVDGGVLRISNTDVRTGYRLTSPDQRAAMILGDVRLNVCSVPGPSGRQFMNQSPGGGKEWCPYRTGEQIAANYVQRVVAGELGVQNLRVTGSRPRPDLGAGFDRLTRMGGTLNFRNSIGEVTFEGTRGGIPVSGSFIGRTLMLYSPAQDLMVGSYTQEISGFVGAKDRASVLAAAIDKIQSSRQWNMQWVMANRAAGTRDTEMVRRYLASEAQLGQQMFESRMAAADRRAEAVGDLLSGQVRLKDDSGHQYTARAGSNYYFLDEAAARVVGNPNDAVVGRDQWKDRGEVDLRPLETIR